MNTRQTVLSILSSKYAVDIADHIVTSYAEIESNFALGKWKASELDAGHFVEAIRRLLELELWGTYTPFDQRLSNFSDVVIKQYEQATGNDESYRMLIPRALKSIFNIRNKRGVGHITGISPNEMDATFILFTSKWVLAELIRLNSTLSIAETQSLVDSIVERSSPLIWKTSDFVRVLQPGLSTRDKILLLLYDQSPCAAEELRSITEYKNKSNFAKIIKRLHTDRLIESRPNGACFISPTGIIEAERLLEVQRNGS